MATQGMVVFCNIYPLLQRGYDQVIHDVAIQNLPVIFCLDRAGLVGEDGGTHHGVFDLAYLRCIPNMIIYSFKRNRTTEYTLHRSTWLRSPNSHPHPRGRGVLPDWQTKNLATMKRLKSVVHIA
jgi:1-deoxy-D-xylulose-5-phosphate synthase